MKYKKITIDDEEGDTYIITDLHGRFDLLKKILLELSVSKQDRIISLGDNVDRGSQSFELLYYFLNRDNAWTLQGNHEITFVRAILNPTASNYSELLSNGGEWVYDYPEGMLESIARQTKECPLLIELNWNNKVIALSHAHIPNLDFTCSVENIERQDIEDGLTSHFTPLISKGDVKGCDLVIHGHRYVEKPTKVGNRIYLDTGASHLLPNSERNLLSVVHMSKNKLHIYQFSLNDQNNLEWENQQCIQI